MLCSRQLRSLALTALLVACGGTVSHSGSNGGAGPTGGTSSGGTNAMGKSCEYDGNTYASGDVVPMGECSSCRCTDGDIACTLLPCDPQGCNFAGKLYQTGESFPAGDGCNTCTCQADGSIGCTLIGCPSNDACQTLADQYVSFISSAAACTTNQDCSLRITGNLPCGCARWINPSHMMEIYQAQMVEDDYQTQCRTDVACAPCPPLQEPGYCVGGTCVSEVLPK